MISLENHSGIITVTGKPDEEATFPILVLDSLAEDGDRKRSLFTTYTSVLKQTNFVETEQGYTQIGGE